MASVAFPYLRPDPEAPDALGTLGAFRVARRLSEGGMGVVFEAIDLRLDRMVAIKVIKSRIAARAGGAEKFQAEAKTLAAIRHHNVVTIHEVGIEQGFPYIVMELLEGQTLETRLKSGDVVDAKEAVAIARGVLQGLQAAHDRGIVHCDVKPANIWLDATDQTVKLIDFGLADQRRGRPRGRTNRVAGTPKYLAPEQARGESPTPLTDLYGAGVTLYLMLSGRLPLDESTPAQQLAAVVARRPRSLQSERADLPGELCRLVDRLLEKTPAQRPGSAAWVANRLEELEPQITETRSVELPEWNFGVEAAAVRTRRSTRRSRRTLQRVLGRATTWWLAGAAIVPAVAVVALAKPLSRPTVVGELAALPSEAFVTREFTPIAELLVEYHEVVAETTESALFTLFSGADARSPLAGLDVRLQPGARRARSLAFVRFRVPDVELPAAAIDDVAFALTLRGGVSAPGVRDMAVWSFPPNEPVESLSAAEKLLTSGRATRIADARFDNVDYRLNDRVDGIRFASDRLIDLVRSRRGQTLLLAIQRTDASNGQTVFFADAANRDTLPKLLLRVTRAAGDADDGLEALRGG